MKDLQEAYIAPYFKNGETGVWNFHQYSFQISLVGILIHQKNMVVISQIAFSYAFSLK